MHSFRALALLAATVLAAAGCSDGSPLSPEAAELVGEWVLADPVTGPRAEHRMSLGADGSYRYESLHFGFRDRPADEVSSYTRFFGRYQVDGDVLLLRVPRVEEWAWGAEDPDVQWLDLAWAERGTVRVEGDQLFHTYVSWALDAPETITVVYRRER